MWHANLILFFSFLGVGEAAAAVESTNYFLSGITTSGYTTSTILYGWGSVRLSIEEVLYCKPIQQYVIKLYLYDLCIILKFE